MYFIKKYFNIVSQNIGSSVLCSISAKRTRRGIRLNSTGIENYLPIPSQFLYLLLLVRTKPYLAKKFTSRKRFRFMEVKRDTAKIAMYPNQARLEQFFAKFINYIMWQQIPPEPSSIKFDKDSLKLVVWNAILSQSTYCLQTSDTAYIDDIPIYLKLTIKDCLSSEVNFWLSFYSILQSKDTLSRQLLKIKNYHYFVNKRQLSFVI